MCASLAKIPGRRRQLAKRGHLNTFDSDTPGLIMVKKACGRKGHVALGKARMSCVDYLAVSEAVLEEEADKRYWDGFSRCLK